MSTKIAELEIEIKDNSTGAIQTVNSLADALKRLKDESDPSGLKTISRKITDINKADFSGFGRLQQALNSALRPAKELADSLRTISSFSGKRLSNAINKVTTQTSSMQAKVNAARATSGTMTDVPGTGEGFDSIAKAQDKATESTKQLGVALKNTTHTSKSFLGIFKSLMPNILSQFNRMLRMKILRTIISSLLRGFSEGLQNVYYWAKATGNQFASSMDTIATSMNYAKNSIGAAFSSILNIVAPIIDQLVDWLVIGINYINMFFATLGGATTYTRAKKNIVEYGTAAAGSLGGAAAAAKELKEQLSVLGFDELNQLQEQMNPSSGGGGGGGAGGGGTNYNDMFETVPIENNWLTRTASWLRENFDAILPIVEAIGAGILAWKVTSAFSSILDKMFKIGELSFKQKLGISMMVTGFTVEALGAYDLGKNGLSLKGALEAAIGAALGVAGSVLTFGSNALGWTVGIAVALTVFVTGFTMGKMKSIQNELKETSESYQKSLEIVEKSYQSLERASEALEAAKNRTIENNEEIKKIALGEELLRQFEELASQPFLSETDVITLQAIATAFNELDLLPIQLQFEELDGKIKSNIDDIKDLLKAYKDLATQAAYTQIVQETAIAIAEATIEKSRATALRETAGKNYIAENAAFAEMLGMDTKELSEIGIKIASGNMSLDTMISAVPQVAKGILENGDDFLKQMQTWVSGAQAYISASVAEKSWEDVIQENTEKQDMALEKLGLILAETQSINKQMPVTQFTTPVNFGGQAITDTSNLNYAPQSAFDSMSAFMTDTQQAWIDSYLSDYRADQQAKAYLASVKEEQQQKKALSLELNGFSESFDKLIKFGGMEGNASWMLNYAPSSAYQNIDAFTQPQDRKAIAAILDEYRNRPIEIPEILNDNVVEGFDVSSAKIIGKAGDMVNELKPVSRLMDGTKREMNEMASATANSDKVTGKFTSTLAETQREIKGGIIDFDNMNWRQKMYVSGINDMNTALGGTQTITTKAKYAANDFSGIMEKGVLESATAISRVGYSVNYGMIKTALENGVKGQNMKTIGTDTKNRIEGEVNKTGKTVTYSGIYSSVSNGVKNLTWGTVGSGVKTGIETQIDKTGEGVNYEGIQKTIADGLSGDKFSNVGTVIKTSITNGIANLADNINYYNLAYAVFNGMATEFQKMMWSNIGKAMAADLKQGIKDALNNQSLSLTAKIGTSITTVNGIISAYLQGTYAQGGFPSVGDLFLANEHSMEMMGTLGGRPAVVNNEQIASALAKALNPMLAQSNSGEETINANIYLDSAVVARATAKGQRAMNKQYNLTARA